MRASIERQMPTSVQSASEYLYRESPVSRRWGTGIPSAISGRWPVFSQATSYYYICDMNQKTLHELEQLFSTIRNERRMHANTAERVGEAFLSILPYLGNFISKDKPETVQYLLTLLAGAVIGDSGQIRLNPDGSITCHSIHVDGSAIFDELVFNRQRVNEGNQLYTDRGVIEQVDILDNGHLRLTFRKEYELQQHTFQEHDCLVCNMNNLDAEGTNFYSWLRVHSVNRESNTVDAVLYPDAECPGGANYYPQVGATVARWGNAVDTDRQQLFYLSATDGNFCFLQGVTKPIINDEGSNTSAFVGLPVESVPTIKKLLNEGTLHRDKTVMYAQTLIAENIITAKHDGTPDYIQREWNEWDPEKQYIRGYDEEEQRYVQDNVWHGGSLWRCIVKKAAIGKEPSLTNTDWVCLRTGGLVLDIESTEGDWYNGDKNFTTTLVAMLMHGDLIISDDDIESVVWTRESGDDAADEAWNINQAKKTQTMALTVSYALDHPELSDIPVGLDYGSKCGFRCTVRYADTERTNTYTI